LLLNIYLGTTAISWSIVFLFCAACDKKLKREGYKYIKEKKSIPEKIVSFTLRAFKGFVPVYNILNAITVLLIGDKVYKYMEDKLLQQGDIYMPTEEMSSMEDEFSSREETKTYTESTEKERTEKKYAEMTLEEKLAYLEREKARLISQSMPIVAQSSEENSEEKLVQDQKEPVLRKTMNPKRK
jgi:hypothetical protein